MNSAQSHYSRAILHCQATNTSLYLQLDFPLNHGSVAEVTKKRVMTAYNVSFFSIATVTEKSSDWKSSL